MNWLLEAVDTPPAFTLDAWSAFEAPLDGVLQPWTVHFVGFTPESSKGRVSSPIVHFDPVTRRSRTRSGRVYELRGNSGMNGDALATWGLWKRKNGVSQERDVTVEVESLLRRACG